MPRFLIQLTHEDDRIACVRALRAIERTGSHYLTHAEWGCRAGVHSGWLIAEADNHSEAIQMVPPEYRKEAVIVELNRFTKEDIASMAEEVGD